MHDDRNDFLRQTFDIKRSEEIELFTCGTLHFKNELENILVTKLDFFILENFFGQVV